MNLSQLAGAVDMGGTALVHLARIEDLLADILDETSLRQPKRWGRSESGVAPGGSDLILPVTMVPVGKRLILQRIATTAPAGTTGACIVYATMGGSIGLDGTAIREVITAPILYANQVAQGAPVDGGMTLVARFVGAAAGICTIRYDGELFDAADDNDIAH